MSVFGGGGGELVVRGDLSAGGWNRCPHLLLLPLRGPQGPCQTLRFAPHDCKRRHEAIPVLAVVLMVEDMGRVMFMSLVCPPKHLSDDAEFVSMYLANSALI